MSKTKNPNKLLSCKARKLAELRKAHNMTQMELAMAIGYEESNRAQKRISNIENQTRTAKESDRDTDLVKIANYFQVPIDIFFEGVERTSMLDNEARPALLNVEKKWIDKYNLLLRNYEKSLSRINRLEEELLEIKNPDCGQYEKVKKNEME